MDDESKRISALGRFIVSVSAANLLSAKPGKTKETQDSLCIPCAEIVDHISRGLFARYFRNATFKDNDCALCKFVRSVLSIAPLSYDDEVYADFISAAVALTDFHGILSICWDSPDGRAHHDAVITIHNLKRVATKVDLQRQLSPAVRGLIPAIQRWLKSTIDEREPVHEAYFRAFEVDRGPRGFYLVDCQDLCLFKTQYANHPQYAALSYVWGSVKQFTLSSENSDRLHQKHAVSRENVRLPESIRDAMDLCSHLQIRYLWVDSLCIAQDDDLMKSIHINHMHTIYQRASVTIVAAAGEDSNGGLPALHEEKLPMKQRLGVNGLYFQELRSNWHIKSLNLPVWSTRAWTLQESVLSERRIIFTKDSVFCSSPKTTYIYDPSLSSLLKVEELSDGNHTRLVPRPGRRLTYDTGGDPALRFYYYLIDYLNRNLTNMNDNLNAFTGIINMLTPSLGPCLFGVPVCEFFWVSLFRIHGNFSRVPSFPSWSWAGCK
jgi:hypothetical protein